VYGLSEPGNCHSCNVKLRIIVLCRHALLHAFSRSSSVCIVVHTVLSEVMVSKANFLCMRTVTYVSKLRTSVYADSC
jgi:hypothetical protein